MNLEHFLQLPMTKWEETYNRLSTDERRMLDDEAAAMATKAARVSAYISRRLSGGTHEPAVKAQNIAARKVRQALGFTYRDDAITF
jgi:hypothetical protein